MKILFMEVSSFGKEKMHQVLKHLLPGKHYRWLLVSAVSLGLSLYLQWNGQIQAIDGNHDSLKYLEMTETLLNGKWLGEYNQMTLIRLPIYPMFLAFNSMIGWPLQRSQVLLYLGSIIFLMAALRTADVSPWRIAVICVLCSFHPAAILAPMYLLSEAIYISVATIVLAGCIGVMGSIKKSGIGLFFWMILLSVSFAFFWCIRTESQWILPLCMCYVFFILWEFRFCYKKKWMVVSFTLMTPCLCACLLTGFLKNENKKYYGISVTHELNEPNFAAVFHWLTRLDGEHHHPYIPVTRAAFNQAYGISPHFSMLSPFLSRQTAGQGWSKFGCEGMGICDELAGGWMFWAVRDAAASIGVYQNAVSASKFYGEVAAEIQTACKDGKIQCVKNPTGNMLAPPLMWMDLPRLFRSCMNMVALAITFGKLSEPIPDAPSLQPPAGLVSRYDRITHDQLPQKRNVSHAIIRAAIRIFQVLQMAGGVWIMIVVGEKIRNRVKNMKRGLGFRNVILKKNRTTGCLIVFILSRIAVVAYIDTMSFYAQFRYLLVIYPALITMICLFLPFSTGFKETHRDIID